MRLDDFLKRFEFLREEWMYLVPSIRYSIIYVFFLIFLLWLDKGLNINFYSSIFDHSFNKSGPNLIFLISNLFLLLIFLILILERMYINIKIIYYKFKYPIKRLNIDFILVNLGGHVCLLDNLKKELRWIKNWQTALDLDFIDEWTTVNNMSILAPSTLNTFQFQTKNGINLKLGDYKYSRGIITQGVPKS